MMVFISNQLGLLAFPGNGKFNCLRLGWDVFIC